MANKGFADEMAQVLEPLGYLRMGPGLPEELLEEFCAVFPNLQAIHDQEETRGLFCRLSDGKWVSKLYTAGNLQGDGWITSEGTVGHTIQQLKKEKL